MFGSGELGWKMPVSLLDSRHMPDFRNFSTSMNWRWPSGGASGIGGGTAGDGQREEDKVFRRPGFKKPLSGSKSAVSDSFSNPWATRQAPQGEATRNRLPAGPWTKPYPAGTPEMLVKPPVWVPV
jgi:hypothetical protein